MLVRRGLFVAKLFSGRSTVTEREVNMPHVLLVESPSTTRLVGLNTVPAVLTEKKKQKFTRSIVVQDKQACS